MRVSDDSNTCLRLNEASEGQTQAEKKYSFHIIKLLRLQKYNFFLICARKITKCEKNLCILKKSSTFARFFG